jgi:lactoylglutathione lyase
VKSKFTYVGIRVTNLQRSIDFYTKVLGMTVIGQQKIKETKGATVGLQSEKDGFVLELNYYEEDSPYNAKYAAGEGLDHLGFKVDSLDKALEEARQAGHPPVLELKINGGQLAYVEDPDGIWIELFE